MANGHLMFNNEILSLQATVKRLAARQNAPQKVVILKKHADFLHLEYKRQMELTADRYEIVGHAMGLVEVDFVELFTAAKTAQGIDV